MPRLKLSTVTLCAATSVNLRATTEALRASLDQIEFGDCILFTDKTPSTAQAGIRHVPIAPMRSSRDYSNFILRDLAEHLRTDHCLIVQWDGFVIDASLWEAGFLGFDYIGAPWPQFDAHDVGNGGFSLRSRRLLEACRDPQFVTGHPEDIAICRTNREFLEREHGLRFADRETASRFAFERTSPGQPTFGFHGIFNLVPIVGADRFWQLYRTLDDPQTAFVDYGLLLRQLGRGRDATKRRLRLTFDRFKGAFGL